MVMIHFVVFWVVIPCSDVVSYHMTKKNHQFKFSIIYLTVKQFNFWYSGHQPTIMI